MAGFLDAVKKLITLKDAKCVYCGRDIPQPGWTCADCRPKEQNLRNQSGFFGGILYVFVYEGIVRALIHRFKYDDMPSLGAYMASGMQICLKENGVTADLITFVPIHPARRAWRGFDQSETLARQLSVLTGIPCMALLKRVRNTRPQFDLAREQRMQNVKGAFERAEKIDLAGKKVLLIDDVCTTGATFAACGKVLSKMGATVVLFAYAREN